MDVSESAFQSGPASCASTLPAWWRVPPRECALRLWEKRLIETSWTGEYPGFGLSEVPADYSGVCWGSSPSPLIPHNKS